MKFLPWLRKWWVLILVGLLLLSYLFIYFRFGSQYWALSLTQFLINSFVSIAVILYVVYTRELTISSQTTAEASRKTAEANIRLVESMQSMLLEQWACELRDNTALAPAGQEVSHSIHVEDKRLPEEKYNEYLGRPKKRTLIFRPFNCGSRPVILYSVKFQISDTRSSRPREIAYDPPTPMVINKDQEKEILVAYNIEGEMEIRVLEISYQDGDKKQNRWIANAYKEISRYQEPKGTPS